MKYFIVNIIRLSPLFLILCACTKPVPSDPALHHIDSRNLPPPNISTTISSLSPCTTSPDPTLHLNKKEPVIVIVHGCKGSAARFRSLAQVFAFHGQQTVCFNYDDRDSLMKSSGELINALQQLSAEVDNKQMTVIGHSQGGLVSRKALIRDRDTHFHAGDSLVRLVTISTPYAGISAADHCSSTLARFITLGLSVPLCKLISGDKWYEITAPSPFIQNPGELLGQVTSHLKIVTDEENSCRRFENNTCVEDDYVFSTDEQYFERIDESVRVENIEIISGHTEIVGDYRVPPDKLIKVLQSEGIMRQTRPGEKDKLIALLAELY